jgi:hypothetical protein
MDGSPYAFYVEVHEGAAPSQDWLLYLEGGGWCNNAHDCALRAQTSLGSSRDYPDVFTARRGGMLSSDCTENPTFCRFKKVELKYCDGASFSGMATEPVAAPPADGTSMRTCVCVCVCGCVFPSYILCVLAELHTQGGWICTSGAASTWKQPSWIC